MTALVKRPTPWKVTTSVIIPCAAKHVPLLPEALKQLATQTVLPDEVVISVSSVTTAPTLPKQPYKVRVIVDSGIAFAGKNRNRAATASRGDLLIYQDADDVSHPQRIEIAKHLFGNFYVEHLLHAYTRAPSTPAAWLSQRHALDTAAARARYEPYSYTHAFHNGNAMTTREVFRHVRWPEDLRRGQDVAYNHLVRNRFPDRMVRLSLSLLTYRQHLSTTRG